MSEDIELGRAFYHPKSGKVYVEGRPDEEHNCDQMGCATIGGHIIGWFNPTDSRFRLPKKTL